MFHREHEFRIEAGGTFAANHDPRTIRVRFLGLRRVDAASFAGQLFLSRQHAAAQWLRGQIPERPGQLKDLD
jgi:hypothetical protein